MLRREGYYRITRSQSHIFRFQMISSGLQPLYPEAAGGICQPSLKRSFNHAQIGANQHSMYHIIRRTLTDGFTIHPTHNRVFCRITLIMRYISPQSYSKIPIFARVLSVDEEHLPRINGFQCFFKSEGQRMIPVVYHFPRRTQINETYVTVYEVTVFRHLKITYRKNNPFSLILRKPLPRKPTHDFPLCLHQIQSGSPVIVVSLCFHHFTVLDGQHPFCFHVAVEPVMHVSHHISFPSPKFPTEPAGLNFSSLTISRKNRSQLLHLIHPCRFLLADLIVDIRFYPFQAKIPITHLPESGIAAIIARRPTDIFRKKSFHPPA